MTPKPITICTVHPQGIHPSCTPEDLKTWTERYGDPKQGGAICPACRQPQSSESCAAREHWGMN